MPAFKRISKQDISILIGNILDHFETPLYGLFAPLIAPLFFPGYSRAVQLILAYSIFASSLITRPLGTFIFGLMAARKGPLLGLYVSLIGVSVTTFGIGCLPTYADIGWWAPLLLTGIRLLKGIFAAGESTIAKLYVLENKPYQKALSISYLYQSSTVGGILLSSLVVTLVVSTDSPLSYWRLPFLGSGVLAFVGFYLRKDFKKSILHIPLLQHNFLHSLKSLWHERKGVMRVAIATSFSYLTYSFPFVFFNAFIPLITNISFKEMMQYHSIFLAFDMVMLPLFGFFTRKFKTEKVMFWTSTLLGSSIVFLFLFLDNASFVYVTLVRFWIVVLGLIYCCPLYVWYLDQFKGHNKYFLVGMGNAIGTATVGRLTPAFCLWLWHASGWVWLPGIYAAIISALATYIVWDKRR